MKKIGTIKELVEYNLDQLEDEMVKVSVKDIVYIQRVLKEMIRLTLNQDHYPNLESFKKFLKQKIPFYYLEQKDR